MGKYFSCIFNMMAGTADNSVAQNLSKNVNGLELNRTSREQLCKNVVQYP